MRNMPAAAFLRLISPTNPITRKLGQLKADTLRGLIQQEPDYDTLYELTKWLQYNGIEVDLALEVMELVSKFSSEHRQRLDTECWNKRRRLYIEFENSDDYGLRTAWIKLNNKSDHLMSAYSRLIRWHWLAIKAEWVEKLRAALLAQIED